MPLDTLAKAVGQAPLAALGIAFMVGVVFRKASLITRTCRAHSTDSEIEIKKEAAN